MPSSPPLSPSLAKDALWYAAIAGAAVGLAPQDAAAQVVYTDPADVTVMDTFGANPAPVVGPAFDFNNNGDAEILFGERIAQNYTVALIAGADEGPDEGTGFIGNQVAGFGYFLPLVVGSTIGPANPSLRVDDGLPSFTFNGSDPNAFIGAGDVFIGVQFALGGSTTDLNYGWIRVAMPAAGTIIVKDYAYEATPNTAIEAGNMGVATEPDALAEGYRFSPIAPNPTSGTSTFEVAVGQAEAVRVEAFDALGRSVSVLHDGLIAAGQTRRLSLDASALPAGVYVVRVTGESFTTSRRMSVVR
jgi:hypothetical protein